MPNNGTTLRTMVQRSTPIESELIVSEQFHDIFISIYSKYGQGHFKHHLKNLDYMSIWMKRKVISRNALCVDVNTKTIGILQSIHFLNANYCLRMHNRHFKLTSPNSV